MPRDSRPSAYLSLYIALRRAEGAKETTLRGYRDAIQRFLATPGMPEDIAELAPEHAIEWLSSMRLRGLSAGGINSYQRPVWTWLRWLYAEGSIETDIARRVRVVRVPTPSRRTATDQMRRDLITVALARPEHPFRNAAIVETLWSTGVRRNELVNLQLKDVDLDAGHLLVTHAKTSKPRVVGVGAQARLAIERYLLHERGRKDGPLFLGRGSRPLLPNGVTLLLRSLGRGVGGGAVSAHDFRRACAARLLESGMAVDDVARQLGHATLTMTLQYGEEGRTKRALDAYHEADSRVVPLRRRA